MSKDQTSLNNGLKLLGESTIPGASLLLDGNILAGAAHAVVGTWARVAFGPIGLALVAANSYASSTTGKNLIKQFTKDEPKTDAAPAAKAETAPVVKVEKKKTVEKKA